MGRPFSLRDLNRATAYWHNLSPRRKHESGHSVDVGEIALRSTELGDKSRISIERSIAKVRSDSRFGRHPYIILQIVVRLFLQLLVVSQAG